MTPYKPDEAGVDRLPGEDDVARVYRDAADDAPPPALDANILAAAHATMARPRRQTFTTRWALPLSVAAMIVLTVGVVLHEGIFDPSMPLPTAAAPADRAEAGAREQQKPEDYTVMDRAPSSREVPAMGDQMIDKNAEVSPRVAREAERKHDAPRAPAPSTAEESALGERERAFQEPAAALSAQRAIRSNDGADIMAVEVTGAPGAYRFAVRIRSPDKGCRQYADWWEVVSVDGKLLYRQVLAHSHVGEQPFVSAGGPVPIQPETVVWVRAHMNTTGYGGTVFKGSPKTGFAQAALPSNFAGMLAQQPPLPDRCVF